MSLADKSNRVDQRAQPSGVPGAPRLGGSGHAPGSDAEVLELHGRLIELEPDAAKRAAALGIPPAVEAAWSDGRMLPVLRAKTKAIRSTIATLEHARSKG